MAIDLEKMDLNETPVLTFDFEEEEESLPSEQEQEQQVIEEVKKDIEQTRLSPKEQKMVDDFASKIDLRNSKMILQYGAGAQKKIADFSETALNSVKTKDLGEVGSLLAGVVTELKSFQVDEEKEEKGIFGFFKKKGRDVNQLKTKYASAETNVNKICKVLEENQRQLLKDVSMLDKMYELNKNYFKELSMYIVAGKQKLEETKRVEIPRLMEQAERTKLPEDAQAVNDINDMCNRFEKKLHDLDLTRMIAIQMAPQIRLIQNNDVLMSEKIQSTIVNTIPLWKSQMILALGVAHQQRAVQAQREVTQMTNELLKKNAETLKMSTIETARETERGIVDIETLKQTNASLISTLDEVLQIQEEGRRKRRNAEQELVQIENELKQKLLSFAKK